MHANFIGPTESKYNKSIHATINNIVINIIFKPNNAGILILK